MKPTLALRSFLLGKALPTAITTFCLLNPSAHAQTWDGGGGDDSTLTANNWNPNTAPVGGTQVLTFAGSTRTSVVWNGVNSVAPVNFYGITFATGASAFTINTGTQTSFQFTNAASSSVILNSSSNRQTLKPRAMVFFNGTKTINGGTSGLALDGGISFRADGLTSGQINKLILTGTADSTTSSIDQSGVYALNTTNSLTKNGSGKWTVTGNVTDTGSTTITQGTLEYQGSISSSSIANNAAMILNNANATSFSYANNITGSGTVTKSDLGTFTLSGASNSYGGATSVNGGTLVVNGNITTSITTVNTGGTLSGTGTVGQVTVAGGTVDPGVTIGVLNTGIYSQTTGTLDLDLAGSFTLGTYDQLNVGGTVTLGGLLTANNTGSTYANGALLYILANDGADAITGLYNGVIQGGTINVAGQDWQISYNANYTGDFGTSTFSSPGTGNDVALMAIPEPSAALLGGLGLLALLRRRRN